MNRGIVLWARDIDKRPSKVFPWFQVDDFGAKIEVDVPWPLCCIRASWVIVYHDLRRSYLYI